MHRRHHRALLTAGPLALALTGLVVAAGVSRPALDAHDTFVAVGSSSNNANPSCNGVNNTTCTGNGPVKTFTVQVGSIGGMYPGSLTDLDITYVNPESFDITVNQVKPVATLTSAVTGCSGDDIAFGAVSRLDQVVPRKGSAHVTIPVGLKPTAKDPCKGQVFTITITATAVMSR